RGGTIQRTSSAEQGRNWLISVCRSLDILSSVVASAGSGKERLRAIECHNNFFCFGRGSYRYPPIVFKLVYLVVHFVSTGKRKRRMELPSPFSEPLSGRGSLVR